MEHTTLFEGMTSLSALIGGIRAGINDRRIERIYIDCARMNARAREVGFLRAVAPELGFVIEETDASTITAMTDGNTHGGIVARCTDRTIPALSEAMGEHIWTRKDGFFALLEGIEDPYNFGYAVRSLYASGVDGIILSPRNWMSAAGIVARASAGTSELLPICVAEPTEAAEILKAQNYRILCAGIRNSVSLYDADMKRPLLLVVGGEKRGISRALLDCADSVVRIDYGRSFRGSLCASAAAAVLGFEVLRQNGGTARQL